MITFFNRKELIMTYDLRDVNRVREILRENGIDYHVKASYPRSPFVTPAGRTRTAYFGPTRKLEQYIIYVRKDDWEYAMHLLRNSK